MTVPSIETQHEPLPTTRQETGGWTAARIFLYLAVAYLSLSSSDITFGALPLKVPVVVAVFTVWLVERLESPFHLGGYKFAWPVLTVGIAVPLVWFVVAAVLAHFGEVTQHSGLTHGLQQGSRFVYVLLYFPITDELRRAGPHGDRLWLWPVYVLCAVAWGLFVGHLFGAHYQGNVGPLHGMTGVEQTGAFRVFLVNEALLIPAFAFVVARVAVRGLDRFAVATLAAVLATLYLAHSRGLWIGVAASTAVIMAIMVVLKPGNIVSSPMLKRAGAWIVTAGLAIVFVVSSDPTLARSTVLGLASTNEVSTSARLDQAPQLVSGFERSPLIGSGLGATLPSGYSRDSDAPWSFELTYLQLLFQLGVLGIVTLLAAPAICILACVRAIPRLEGRGLVLAKASAAGLIGLLLTCAGNPYLMTSVGMLALALLLSFGDQALSRGSADWTAD